MKQFTRYALVLGLGLFIGAGVTLDQAVRAERTGEYQPLPLEDLRVFAEVFGKIKSDYVEEIEDRQLLQNAIQGMLSGLDPHSAYLDPDAYRDMRVGTEGEFGGLGIEVTMEDGFVKVVAPIDDTPAHRAGLLPGDLIVRLDEAPVKGMTLDEAVRMMRGRPGSSIRLTIVREGVAAPLEVDVMRDVIRITSVRGGFVEPGYAYVRVTHFQTGTAEALRARIAALLEENGEPLHGLVLDLRNNPGGVLNGAVAVADLFLSSGVIVSTRGRTDDARLSFSATGSDSLEGTPMVLLVNEGSASASEIVAGALQDHRRAVVMGTRTFGKGSVQTILPMANGAALKITTARYYTPQDRSIQAKGIEPDVVVEDLQVSARGDGEERQQLREADLIRHLDSDGEVPTEELPPPQTPATNVPTLEDDYQLREAINLLKGINIITPRSSGQG
jgi:carboxyl-terminal processing protease